MLFIFRSYCMKWLMTLGITFFKTVYFEIIINSQEVAKEYREVPCNLHPVSLCAYILYDYVRKPKPGNGPEYMCTYTSISFLSTMWIWPPHTDRTIPLPQRSLMPSSHSHTQPRLPITSNPWSVFHLYQFALLNVIHGIIQYGTLSDGLFPPFYLA